MILILNIVLIYIFKNIKRQNIKVNYTIDYVHFLN